MCSAFIPISLGYYVRTTSFDSSMIISDIPSFKNPPNEIWNKTYGRNLRDAGEFIQQTEDDGYIIVGYTNSFGSGDFDIWLIKTDIDGNELWNKTYGGPYADSGHCIIESSNKNFLILGASERNVNGVSDVLLIKTDKYGNEIFYKKYKYNSFDTFGECIIELNDGYLIIASMYINFKTDIWMVKTDFDGNEIWNKAVGGRSGRDTCNSVIQTSDGDFVIVGGAYVSKSLSSMYEVALLIKTDENGNRLWRRTYESEEASEVIEIEDKGYLLVAGELSEAFLIKTDKDGNELWRKTYFGKHSYWIRSFAKTSDGGFVIAGTSAFNAFDGVIFKVDASGNKFWEILIGGSKRDVIECIIESNDGNYVSIGTSESYGTGDWDAWLVKISPFDNIRPNIPSKPIGPNQGGIWIGYNFSTSSSDPDGNLVYFTWTWGSGPEDVMEGPYSNGEICEITNTWTESGNFNIKVKAVDIYGGESDWSEPLRITIPRSKVTLDSVWLRLLEVFPLLKEVILRLIR